MPMIRRRVLAAALLPALLASPSAPLWRMKPTLDLAIQPYLEGER